MELLTDRLRLIPCTEQSVDRYLRGDEIAPHIKMCVNGLRDDPSLLGWGVWLVLDKINDTVLGDIGFKGKPDAENQVEVGYGIMPFAQKKGYATEAVREIIRWAFSKNEVERILAECLDDNFASIKVLEKQEMRRTGKDQNMLKWELKK